MDPRDPSAFGETGAGGLDEPEVERATMSDGRLILYFSWPDEPSIEAVLPDEETVMQDTESTESAAVGQASEPWSPETQPLPPDTKHGV